MRDLKIYPDQNQLVVIHDEHGMIYGHNVCRMIIESGEAMPVAVFRGITIDVFCAYLQSHFPNYECVKSLKQVDQITPAHLEAISEAITLTVGDAMYMRDFQTWAQQQEQMNSRTTAKMADLKKSHLKKLQASRPAKRFINVAVKDEIMIELRNRLISDAPLDDIVHGLSKRKLKLLIDQLGPEVDSQAHLLAELNRLFTILYGN